MESAREIEDGSIIWPGTKCLKDYFSTAESGESIYPSKERFLFKSDHKRNLHSIKIETYSHTVVQLKKSIWLGVKDYTTSIIETKTKHKYIGYYPGQGKI